MAELTKHGQHSNIKIPPESTGNRLAYTCINALSVSNFVMLSAPLPWKITTSDGVSGLVVGFGDIKNLSDKRLDVIVDDDSISIDFTVGQTVTVTRDEIIKTGVVSAVERIYSQSITLVGGNNTNNTVGVDNSGSLLTRFPEGAQQLDPKGLTRISTPTTVMDIKFIENTNDVLCFGATTGDASQTFDPVERILLMDVGTGAGDRIVKRSNRSAFFQGGFGMLYETTLAIGDNGKSGVIRRWGHYSDTDGLFFELNGTDLYVVIRSSTTGSVVETRVSQDNWNRDTLLGGGGQTNRSEIKLLYSMMNYYFIDFASSTAGKVRFGIGGGSGRVIAHEFFLGNNAPFNFMRTAILPMTWEIVNTSATASPSRMKTLGGSVINEGFATPDSRISIAANSTYTMASPKTVTGAATINLASARAGKLLPNGDVNKKVTIPQKFSYYVAGGPVLIQIRVGLVPDGSVWFKPAPFTSPAEIDVTGTFPESQLSQGLAVLTRMYAPGTYIVDPPESFNLRGQGLSLRSDGEYGLTYTFTAKAINPGDTVSVMLSMDWFDV